MTKNYYEILGIETNATDSEIKSAFRRLARKWHPDVAGNTDEIVKKFKEINEAYEILSNPQKREKYDTLRGILNNAQKTADKKTANSSGSTSDNKTTSKSKTVEQESDLKKEDSNKTTSDNKNTFQDAWDSFIKKTKQPTQKQKRQKPQKIDGTDITSDIIITVSESILGTTRSVNILHSEPCPKCHGRKFANGATCSECNGTGEISIHKKLSVKIPENVKQGAKIRISGEGNKGYNGGKNGDLYLIVKIDVDNSPYKYDGLNILQTVPVEPFEAVLGTTIHVKTPNGSVAMKISSGTMNGQKYRLARQGLTKDDKIGDMIVTIAIEIPKNLSKEEVLLYKKLKELADNRDIRETLNGK